MKNIYAAICALLVSTTVYAEPVTDIRLPNLSNATACTVTFVGKLVSAFQAEMFCLDSKSEVIVPTVVIGKYSKVIGALAPISLTVVNEMRKQGLILRSSVGGEAPTYTFTR